MNNNKEEILSSLFSQYTENKDLKKADIFHLYDTGELCVDNQNGFYDSRFFDLYVFNRKTMEKKYLGIHDAIFASIFTDIPVIDIRVFIDGSFFVKFKRQVDISEITQALFIK